MTTRLQSRIAARDVSRCRYGQRQETPRRITIPDESSDSSSPPSSYRSTTSDNFSAGSTTTENFSSEPTTTTTEPNAISLTRLSSSCNSVPIKFPSFACGTNWQQNPSHWRPVRPLLCFLVLSSVHIGVKMSTLILRSRTGCLIKHESNTILHIRRVRLESAMDVAMTTLTLFG